MSPRALAHLICTTVLVLGGATSRSAQADGGDGDLRSSADEASTTPPPSEHGTVLTTSLSPTAGIGLRLPNGVALAAQAQLRMADVGAGEGQGQGQGQGQDSTVEPGFLLGARVGVGLNEIFGIHLGYAFAKGQFPIDGTAGAEHRVSAGAKVGMGGASERRFTVHNTLKAELRILGLGDDESADFEDEDRWFVRVRPRNETRLDMSLSRWFGIGVTFEGLAEPQLRSPDWLQLRAGLLIRGSIPLGRRMELNPEARRLALNWLVGDVFAFRPLSMYRARKAREALHATVDDLTQGFDIPGSGSSDAADEASELDGALHMMLTFGLSLMI